jgi:ElaA protein
MTDPEIDVRFRRRAFAELTGADLYEILKLRGDVFVVEQRIWQENDLDGCDRDALHILGYDAAGALVATARLLQDDSPIRVGRIVVRRDRRGQGVGSALLAYIESLLGPCAAEMSAQATLEDWYARRGWQREGDVYDEVGIPHVRLVRTGPPRDAS